MQACLNASDNATWDSLSFLGNQTYIYVCGLAMAGFTFVPGDSATQPTILNLSS